MNLQYEKIGTHPQVANVNLEKLIAEYKAANEVDRHLIATTIHTAAEHFYGLSIEVWGTTEALIDAMEGLEQHTMVH